VFVPRIPQKVHFIGIGGVGMSGIAQILLSLGHRVSGSDARTSVVTERLQGLGARIYHGHSSENVGDVEIVVISSAIAPDNPEVLAAYERGIRIIPRAQMLGLVMREQKGIAVAGAHGKTTTTSLAAFLLEKAGLDPTFVIGGEAAEIGNAKVGTGGFFVAEADESDGSFVLLDPTIAIVTNVENDHLDHYKTLDNIERAFRDFLMRVPPEGVLVLCADDPILLRLAQQMETPVITYGRSADTEYRLDSFSLNCVTSGADVYWRGEFLGRLELSIPGRHNLLNALGVLAMGRYLGLEFGEIAGILKAFRGVKRRFETMGEIGGVRVVDDYAHHPTEVQVTLEAARQTNPGRLIAVFQPHRYTRTQFLHKEFGQSFSKADIVLLNSIYSAGEAPIEGVTAQLIVDEIKKHRRDGVHFFETQDELVGYLSGMARAGDLILTLGAGDIRKSGVALLKRLEGSAGGNSA
jgi:UDP-N-acetylmuramate--alanine ligase